MAKTINNLPYPIGTDYVAAGDDAIKALAEALRMTHGQVNIGPPSGGNLYAEATVNFPAGLFTAPPIVVASGIVNQTGSSLIVGVVSVTAAQVVLRIASNSGGTFGTAYLVRWFAIQLPAA